MMDQDTVVFGDDVKVEGLGYQPDAEETMTLDDLFNIATDAQEEAQAEAALLDYAGTYISIPEMGFSISRKDDGFARDGSPLIGRPTVSIYGRGEGEVTVKEGVKEHKTARIQFYMSHVPGYKKDKDGNMTEKPDFKFANYLAAKAAYKVAFGVTPEGPGHVVDYLVKYPAKFNVQRVGVPYTKKDGTVVEPREGSEPGTMVREGGVRGIKV